MAGGAFFAWFGQFVLTTGTALALLGGLAYLCRDIVRTYFTARIEKAIQHDFDVRLAKVEAELKDRSAQLSALRDGALSGIRFVFGRGEWRADRSETSGDHLRHHEMVGKHADKQAD